MWRVLRDCEHGWTRLSGGYNQQKFCNSLALSFHATTSAQSSSSPPVPVQAMRGHPNYQAHTPLTPYRQPMNNVLHPGPFHNSRDSQEAGPRHHPRLFPSNGLRIYRPHRNGIYQKGAEGRNSPHLIFLAAHELLALGERIGSVKTGLSEDTILRHLKTRHVSSFGESYSMDRETGESYSMDRETETCIVCQIEYENQEKIWTLDCGLHK